MKYLVYFLFFFLFTSFSRTDKLIDQLTQQIDDWHLAAANADFERYFSATSKDFIFLGTAPNERWTKTEFMAFSKPYFEAGKAWDFKSTQKHFSILDENKLVVFDEDLDTWMNGCRGSGIFRKEKGKWVLVYYNLTVLIENEKIDNFIRLREQE
ncbi:MAG: nuclear transport factor 2 family protein [Lishizhenia sp.]